MAEAGRTLSQINQSVTSVSRRADRVEECEIRTDHDHMLSEMQPSCMAISALGYLMLVTHEHDFSLAERPPVGGFKVIKYPHSLRASLVQVSNDAHEAFTVAQVNMDNISRLTVNIPDLLNEIVQAAAQGTEMDLKIVVRDALEKLKKRAKRCVDLATSTKGKYDKVMDEIKELIEAATATKGYQDERLREAVHKHLALQEQKKIEEQAQMESRQRKEEMKEVTRKAREMYQNAVEDMPGNMMVLSSAFAQEIIRAGSNYMMMRKVLPAVCNTATSTANMLVKSVTSKQAAAAGQAQQTPTTPTFALVGITSIKQILLLIPNLFSCFYSTQDGSTAFREPEGGVISYETRFQNMATELAKETDEISNKTFSIIRSLIQICKELTIEINKNDIHGSADEYLALKNRLTDQLQHAESLDTAINAISGASPTDNRSPVPDPSVLIDQKDDKSAINTALDNAHFKLKRTQEMLKMYEEKSLTAEKEAHDKQEKLQQTMTELREIDFTRIDLENVKQTLQKGLNALTTVSQVWSELVLFFSGVASMVETTFYEDVLDFEQKARNVLDHDSVFQRALMYDYVRNATESAIGVHSLASMYTEVSRKYLMPPLTTLPRLVNLDGSRPVQQLAQELDMQCVQATAEISQLAEDKREAYRERVRSRIARVEQARQALPPIPAQQQQRNSQAIQDGLAGRLPDVDPNDF